MEKEEKELEQEKKEEVIEESEKEEIQEPQINTEEKSSDEKDDLASNLIQQQALQYHYIEKLESSLNKDELTIQDIQNIQYCKSQILSQILSVGLFSETLAGNDSRKVAVDALSTHLTNLYSKTSKLQEKMAAKKRFEMEKMDVAESMFGLSKYSDKDNVITDNMLTPNANQIKLALAGLSPELATSLGITEMVKNPSSRLTSSMSELLEEFKKLTSPNEKTQFTEWTETLVNGLSKLGNSQAMNTALQGVNLSKMMKQFSTIKNF